MPQEDDEEPADWRVLLDEAELCLREQRLSDCLQFCDRAAMSGDEARYHAAILRGDVLMELGDPAGALSAYDSIADPDASDPDLDCARGIALFELGSLPEADNALRSALRGKPELAEAHYTLGLVAELLGTGEEVERFRQARRLAPDRFPAVAQMSRPDFERAIREALETLPETIRDVAEGLPILVAELPHPDDIRRSTPSTLPTATGVFVPSLPPEHPMVLASGGYRSGGSHPAIVLFKRNIERASREPDDVTIQIRETVVEELLRRFPHLRSLAP